MNTPRTDAEALKWGPYEGVPSVILPVHFARQLETELAAAQERIKAMEVNDARWRKARTIFSIEDIERAEYEMRGGHPQEEENLKADAAIDASIAASAQVNAEPKPLMQCSCGEPWTLNVVHRNPEPCFYWQAAPASDTSAPDAGQVAVPVEPTQEMLDAAQMYDYQTPPHLRSHSGLFQAMLRAAGSRQDG